MSSLERGLLDGSHFVVRKCEAHAGVEFLALLLCGALGPQVGIVYVPPAICPVCIFIKGRATGKPVGVLSAASAS